MVHGLGSKLSSGIGICETCIHGKHKRSSFKTSRSASTRPLELVHSDVCGKMSSPSLGEAEYFLTLWMTAHLHLGVSIE